MCVLINAASKSGLKRTRKRLVVFDFLSCLRSNFFHFLTSASDRPSCNLSLLSLSD